MSTQIVELSNQQFIQFSGPDVRKFLQGQLSCNLEHLSAQRSLRGAICNLQGRVIADLRVLQLRDDCLLQVAAGMANIVVSTLSKYAVFSKVKFEIQDLQPVVYGFLGTPGEAVLKLVGKLPDAADAVAQTADASLIRLPGTQERYELWLHSPTAAKTFRASLNPAQLATAEAWKRADIEAGVVHVDSATTEEYTPQLLNYDISGVIDFKKGCYTGQEVVARMFYRGVAKKRLFLATTPAPIGDDDRVHQEGNAEDRHAPILAYSNAPAGSESDNVLLTVLGTDAVGAGNSFHLADRPTAKLSVLPLAY